MVTPYQPYIEMEAFLGSGGYVLFVRNPSLDTLIPFYNKLQDQFPFLSMSVTVGDPERYYYSFTNWALDCTQANPYFNNGPALGFAVSADNTICATIFVFDSIVNGEEHVWINNWVGLPTYKGAGSMVGYVITGIYLMREKPLATNIDQLYVTPTLRNAITDRPQLTQDSQTLWHHIPLASGQAIAYQNYEFATTLPNFSKLAQNFPTIDELCVYDWNNKIWYPKSEAPQNLGTPPVFEDSQVYKFNPDMHGWEPFIVPWK